MATHLQQLLRSLCLNTEWNYAVFWKLRCHAQMVLTCEDAYYDSHGNFESEVSRTNGSMIDECIPHESLGLAVAKMSCQVYSLGEGVIGQVAVIGKHKWLFAHELAVNSLLHERSAFQHCDGWQEQLLAGVQTIVVVAVIPYGVMQLGSVNKVNENPKQLAHLRDLFSTVHSPSSTHVLISMQQQLHSMLHMPNNTFGADIHGCLFDSAKDVTWETPYVPYQKQGGDFHGGISSISDNVEHFKLVHTVYQKEESTVNAVQKVTTTCLSNIAEGQTSNNVTIPNSKIGVDCNRYSPSPSLMSSLSTSSGSELHEALAPAFSKQNYPSWWDMEKSEHTTVSDIADGMEQSMVTSETGTDQLLEAVVANFCHKDKKFKRLKSFCSSPDSSLTTEKMPELSSNTSHTVKGNKKRARPGENWRPRPRDRQLVQDRIKELRDLVPNGSKCSIDSLLERTVKHMLFLQSISKDADNLKNCGRSRVNKDNGFSKEQGISWVVEVSGGMKICPIVVESLSMNGQLLIEMLCEDCDRFLKFTEVIKGLGLTILKATTEDHADKTRMRFVVEGKKDRNLDRMDVLWSLLQILQ